MNNKTNTLVILTPGFPESEADTNCLPMQQSFVQSVKENFPQLNIIILSFQYPYFKKRYKWFDTTVISFNGKNKGGFARLLLRRKLKAVLDEINRSNKITGILSFWYGECAWAGKKFADKNNIMHFCWMLGQDAKKVNKYIKRTRQQEDKLIALSDFLQDEFEKNHGARPQYVIPPGIDTNLFAKPIKEKDIDIIAAGSLIPLKQYEIFIEVAAAIKKQMPGIKAMLIGAGPERSKLEALIIKHELQLNIMLAGELPHAELLQWMQRGKVFLHPSSYEGFGVVCIEGLYAGCHVISFCKPMKHDIHHWHIVNNKCEMKQKALDILLAPQTEYKSVTFSSMPEVAKKLMQLYDL